MEESRDGIDDAQWITNDGTASKHHSESPPQGRIVVGDGARRGWRPSSRLLSVLTFQLLDDGGQQNKTEEQGR